MCGLAGSYAPAGQRASRAFLLNMAGELAHRGPDGVGLYLDGRFGMTNTRLSIVDLAGGDQPLSNEDGRLWVMQNGEIYNYLELKSELEAKGHRFATRCDTEVLVHAFEEWGAECLQHLNGEFAFAVWDRVARELFLARDRFGIRPLFLSEAGGGLHFASEAKALLRHPQASRRLDPVGLRQILTLWATLPDRSAFEGIRELPPGHYLTLGPDGEAHTRCWWDVPFAAAGEVRTEGEGVLTEELLELLTDAVRIRLRADVPVGVYLSGGLDSSAAAALSRQFTPDLRAFALSFADARYDESVFQAQMAEALGVRLEQVTVGQDIAKLFPEVVRLAEKPLLRTAPSPLLKLSAKVHEAGLKVVLTGEGADELFAGYGIFQEAKVRRFWARQPSSKLRPLLLGRLHPYLVRELSAKTLAKSYFASGLTDTDDPLYSHRMRFKNAARLLRFVTPEVLEAGSEANTEVSAQLERSLSPAFSRFSDLSKAQYLEIHTFLEGYLLHSQGDRMLMGNAVEGRFPFLDYRLAEFAARLPNRFRLRGLKEKYLLRQAVAPLLPDAIAKRPKRPYRAPIGRSFSGPEAPAYVQEVLRPESLREAGLFDAPMVARLLTKCQRHADSELGLSEADEMALVAVLSSQLLFEALVKHPELAPAAYPAREVHGDSVSRLEAY
jgi:asparagine synthase (glutamine-hydrolysing)